MENITTHFNDIYLPVKALVIYQSSAQDNENVFVEAYDMNKQGKPVNAHPLSIIETMKLAESLNTGLQLRNNYLKSSGLLPDKVLYINPSQNGFAIWYTPEQEVELLFIDTLNIPSGKAFVPPLIWKAGKEELEIYAFKSKSKPAAKTTLFRAPFFNLHASHKVCMGTVDTGMENIHSLEDFIRRWEQCYWNSYFSHMLTGTSPVKGNIVQLWQTLMNGHEKFPLDVLITANKTIKDLLT
ncbi:MAG TPA: hypothetical protein VG738_18620 [Chitinophagaceae bacterium]|nr:hypothetical protein [Chitinophagaceae bacterium]